MKLSVAILQMDIKWGDIKTNISAADSMTRSLNGCDLLVLPEMFTTGFMMTEHPASEGLGGYGVTWMRSLAVEKNMAVAGSLIVNTGTGKPHNRFLFVHPDGVVEWYDKRHLFSYSGEDKLYEKGYERRIINYKGFRILPQICYDLRFPVWSRNRNDYDMSIYVASWPESRIGVWDTLLRARAIENQCYVIGANRIGNDPTARYNGHSAAIDFYGNPISILTDNTQGIIEVELDMERLEAYRNKFRAWADADNFDLKP